jgi:DNA replication ATP-dependent helicase Dna2
MVKTVVLRGIWFDTPATTNAFVHIIGKFQRNGQCIIDDNNNLLILHPDHLVSSTVVADSFGCVRRAVLQDRVKATSDSSAPLVYGTILHEIFQAAMLANRWDTEWLTELIENTATRHLEDLYTIKLQVSQAVEYLQSKMGELQAWAELFVSSKPNVCNPLSTRDTNAYICSPMRLSRLATGRKLPCVSANYLTLKSMFGLQCMG